MPTMAEEFKKDFDESVPEKDWYDLGEFKYFHGWLDKISSTGSYDTADLPFSKPWEPLGREYIIFTDRSWVVAEIWDQDDGIQGNIFVMPTPEAPVLAEKARDALIAASSTEEERARMLGTLASVGLPENKCVYAVSITFTDGSKMSAYALGSGATISYR